MSLKDLCRTDVITIAPQATVRDAARLMRDHHVGALVVLAEERVAGIVTDRDLTIQVLAEGREPHVPVRDVMTPYPATLRIESGLSDAAQLMREHGVRRLPIVDAAGKLQGIISLDDILALLGEELATLAGAVGHEQMRELEERAPHSHSDKETAA